MLELEYFILNFILFIKHRNPLYRVIIILFFYLKSKKNISLFREHLTSSKTKYDQCLKCTIYLLSFLFLTMFLNKVLYKIKFFKLTLFMKIFLKLMHFCTNFTTTHVYL